MHEQGTTADVGVESCISGNSSHGAICSFTKAMDWRGVQSRRGMKSCSWRHVMARLRQRVAAGDAAAMTELGITINDGIRGIETGVSSYDATRRMRSASCGGQSRAVMKTLRVRSVKLMTWVREYGVISSALDGIAAPFDTAIVALLPISRRSTAIGAILRAAIRWALRAMQMGDGDAAVTAGYDYSYGIGVRRSVAMARRLFWRALRGNTSQYGREEALYNLAVAHADNGDRKRSIQLLRRANKDGDYAEAASLLALLTAKVGLSPCRCRRDLRKDLNGHAPCRQHPVLGRPRASR